MKQLKKVMSWWFTAIVAMMFAVSGAFGTQPRIGPEAYILTSDIKPVKIGEKAFIPVRIEYSPKWKSAKISLEVRGGDLNLIKIEKLELDSTIQAPYIAYIPITVTGEGRFDFKIHVSIESPDGEKFRNGESNWSVFIGYLGIFSFEGKVFFGGSSGSAMEAAVVENLKKTNSEFFKLLSKKEKINSGVLRQTFSEEEENKLKELIDKADRDLRERYYKRYPIIEPSPTSRLFREAPLSKPQTGEVVNLEVNWSTDAAYTSFLPLDGAEITVYANENNGTTTQISKGILSNGKYSFTSPRDNLSFTANITARYGSDFEVHNGKNGIDNGIIEIGFKDVTNFNIAEVNNSSPLLEIEPYEANAWSVFQAFVELHRLAQSELGVSKNSGYNVYIESQTGSFYDNPDIYIGSANYFDWDVMAHEFGHAIAEETSSTLGNIGGLHYLFGNQYDTNNGAQTNVYQTYGNKQNSLDLAFNEGYATWLGISLLENSKYNNTMPNVGDGKYLSYNLEPNTLSSFYGEDAEFAISNLLWDITDSSNEANNQAKCSTDCKDSLTIPLLNVFNKALQGKNIASISDFYKHLYRGQVGSEPSNVFNSLGSVSADNVTKTHQLGAIFAEFGIAPSINESSIGEKAFFGIYKQNFTPPTLVWKHFQTGNAALYLDNFEILFFNKDKTALLYKITVPNTLTPNINKEYRYTLSQSDVDGLRNVLKITYTLGINVIIKGTASGNNAQYGAVQTGPYYSNLASFNIDGSRLSVIAVDSSGSNTATDPSNLRIYAAHKMLKNIADANKKLLENATNTDIKPTLTAAIDFDSSVRVLASFTEPQELYDRKIFNAIDSSGGTDIAEAIIYSTDLIAGYGSNVFDLLYNRNNLYVLTDMQDDWPSVMAAIVRAYSMGVYVNVGHLAPMAVNAKTMSALSSSGNINGDPVASQSRGPVLMSARTSFDDIIELLIE
ncbi:MAG: VWA domain-containing protein, partial [Campylobacteraceae bacterium]|nr:VWA domain-containing protein [Campylobacteraceae bacterium]